MASSQPIAISAVMSSSEESSVVQVMDSREPLVAASSSGASCVQVLDSSEPLAHILACDQVLDSSEPLGATSSDGVQVLDTEPLVHHIEPVAGGSRNLDEDVSFYFVACDPDMLSSNRGTTSVATLRSCMNIVQLFEELGTTEQCITFAEEEGLLPTEKVCTYHKRPMCLRTGKSAGSYGTFRCNKEKCRSKSVSRAKGTWFEKTKLAITTMFHLMYMFCYNYPMELARHNARNKYDPIVSSSTVANWYTYCRETIVTYEQDKDVEKPKIGGPGKIVQIDESNFGRRKNFRGHLVIGMIENNSDDLRLEVCPDNERSAEVLVPLIQKHVEEGTEIHTDSLSAYDCLSQYGYIHKKVNHSDPNYRFGIHTQRIKGHWRYMKTTCPKHKIPGDFKDWLVEYRWRRRIKLENKCAFQELINAIKHVYKPAKGR